MFIAITFLGMNFNEIHNHEILKCIFIIASNYYAQFLCPLMFSIDLHFHATEITFVSSNSKTLMFLLLGIKNFSEKLFDQTFDLRNLFMIFPKDYFKSPQQRY